MRRKLTERVSELIGRLSDGRRDDAARDALLRELLRFQREHVPVYDKLARALAPRTEDPLEWPAVPTDVFRFARVAAHGPDQDARVFATSGTGTGVRGRHFLRDLSLYDRAARAAARYALFPDRESMALVLLAPSELEAPDSSLSYMLERFAHWFGAGETVRVLRDGRLDVALFERTLRDAEQSGRPLALLGTSFAFVHADEALGTARYALPRDSRIMQTGGFKGRSRELAPEAMLELLGARYGLPQAHVVQEYGMTELSSQLYETTLRAALTGAPAEPRRLWVPGWVRASVVDPERLQPVPEGAEGLLRIDDLCNVDTACAIQTSDRARAVPGGVIVLGRAAGATPRGCSLAVDAVLGAR